MKDPPPPEPPLTAPDGVLKRPLPSSPPCPSPPPPRTPLPKTPPYCARISHPFLPTSCWIASSPLSCASKKKYLAASDLVSMLALSPEMAEAFYAHSLRDVLSDALRTLQPIEELRHVECSMPSVATEALTLPCSTSGGSLSRAGKLSGPRIAGRFQSAP